MPLTSAERTSLIKLASQIPTGSPERKVILDHIVKQAGAKVSPEETAWLKGELQALVKRLGGRVLRDAGSTLEFTYPDNPAVKKVTISQIGQPHVLYLIENQEGVITSTCHNCLVSTEWGLDVTFENFPHDEGADCVRARETVLNLVNQIPDNW